MPIPCPYLLRHPSWIWWLCSSARLFRDERQRRQYVMLVEGNLMTRGTLNERETRKNEKSRCSGQYRLGWCIALLEDHCTLTWFFSRIASCAYILAPSEFPCWIAFPFLTNDKQSRDWETEYSVNGKSRIKYQTWPRCRHRVIQRGSERNTSTNAQQNYVVFTFLTLFTAAFSFLSHFLDAFCICFDVNRRLINSSSSDTEFPMM